MQSEPQDPYVIVVGIDYSASCARALNEAFALAAGKPGAEPHLISVAAHHESLPDGFSAVNVKQAAEQLETYARKQLAEYVERHPDRAGFERVCTHQRVGEPANQIVQLAVDLEADLIMVGSHCRRGIERLLLGSVAEKVVRSAPCPVLVVRPKTVPDAPKIEPACPRCIEARKSSGGKDLWCAQHSEHHAGRHTYHYVHRNMRESPPLMR